MNHRTNGVGNVDGGYLALQQLDDRAVPSVRVTVRYRHKDSGVESELSVVLREQDLENLVRDAFLSPQREGLDR